MPPKLQNSSEREREIKYVIGTVISILFCLVVEIVRCHLGEKSQEESSRSLVPMPHPITGEFSNVHSVELQTREEIGICD